MRVLAYTSPSRGHLYPLVPVLDELAARGHAVALRTLASQVEALAARGFAAAPIAPGIEALPHDDFRGRTPLANLRRGWAMHAVRAPLEVGDLRAALEEEAPDVVLVDGLTWGAAAAAEAWGEPWGAWFPYPLPLSAPGVPPFGPGLPPARGALGRVRDRLVGPLAQRPLAAVLPAVNTMRAAAGVPPLPDPDALFLRPPLMLHMTAEPLEYPRHHWPPSVRNVGPCAWNPPGETPGWVEGVDRPFVLVSTSSEFQDDHRLVTTALEALAGEDLHVVATLPAGEAPPHVPANAHVEQWVPHGPILARAACAITHGGAGATQKALAAGVPVCVVPFGRDQLEVARRVEVAGAGTRLPPWRLSPGRLRAAVRAAMSRRDGARRVAEGFAAAGGPPAAADAVEELGGATAARAASPSGRRTRPA